MNNIEWKDGAAFLADTLQYKIIDGKCYYYSDADESWCSSAHGVDYLFDRESFQLNEIREGDFIPASELDTEQKYNDVAEVFGLFGFEPYLNYDLNKVSFCKTGNSNNTGLIIVSNNVELDYDSVDFDNRRKRKLTYDQLMAIGKLKRMMLEREVGRINKEFNESEIESVLSNAHIYSTENFPKIDLEEKPKRRNKSKQAYDILKSLDYEYDLVKQKWFKKVYIND